MTKFANVGSHAEDVDGRMVAPGEKVELSAEQLKDVNISTLVEDGTFLKVDASTVKKEGDK